MKYIKELINDYSKYFWYENNVILIDCVLIEKLCERFSLHFTIDPFQCIQIATFFIVDPF